MQMRKLCASKIEWKYIYQLIQAIENENIRNYVENQIAWCVVKASRYRFYDYTLKLLTVLMPTVVVVLQQCLDTNDLLAQMAVLGGATVTSASSIFIKFHDKRVLYRNAAEQLKAETLLFITRTGKYKAQDCEERFVLELDRIVKCSNEAWGRIEEEKKEETKKEEAKKEKAEEGGTL